MNSLKLYDKCVKNVEIKLETSKHNSFYNDIFEASVLCGHGRH